ncbi:MFS general substrate transporter [Glarea lozoyensis ATCC 20868]|uniref:MFS general substrate transporter n=1 Tax=Glarea lozoyensis (strain ATCC 20868 / MF5171) TaxID=1116229 RepID=S3DB07_GLAL2|nr:MFS general substrate transporter [Glarea lozoyensis ATCC 20868]EPE34915.1 MFS general substrate transporter [Glarea lozoyensis ATCC 20868]
MAEQKSITDTTAHRDDKERGLSTGHISLNENLGAKIRNPLAGISRELLLQNVTAFTKEKGLEEYTALFRKGALVAQDPGNYEDITGEEALTPEEVEVLRDEVLHKWRHPMALYLTIFTCSIGAAVQGWDQTGSNGANLSFPNVFGIGSTSTKDTLLVGLVNSAPYIGSAFVGCWVSDPINYYVGRRGAIFIAAVFCFLPVFGSALSQSWQQLFVCRLLLGFGMGAKGSTIPIYAAENSPAAIRGALVMSWQLWTAFGIFLGTCANLAMVNVGKYAWRYQLGSAFIPAVPLLLFIYLCPESPRWCMKKNRYPQALRSLIKLRNNPLQAARDMYYIHAQLEVEYEIIGNSNYFTRFAQLFTIPRVRRATLASFTVMIAQQMCGINIIAFYSSTIFKNSGFTDFQALFASFGFGLINFLFAFPAIWTIDTFGRRALLLFTFPNMAWSLLAAGLCALIPVENKAHLGLVALFVYIFAMFYSPGEGPVPFTYSAEVFPLSHREVGMGWAVATCLFWATILTMFLPLMLEAMGTTGVFCFYAGTNIVALVMIFLWVPETKQRTLEELDYIFAVPTRVHMRYQITEALPWWFNRWILRKKGAVLRPLYQFDTSSDQDRIEALYAADKARADKKTAAGSDSQIENTRGSSEEITQEKL